jgi:hypothetical protein
VFSALAIVHKITSQADEARQFQIDCTGAENGPINGNVFTINLIVPRTRGICV